MGKIANQVQHFKRYKKIGEVLMKYGFDFVAEQLWEKGYIPKFVLKISPMKGQLTQGERLRYACEELGPTFIKLGQIISTRGDLFPEEMIEELSKLQDHVAPFPFEQAKDLLEAELGGPITEKFRYFSQEPMASASIGQVYEAVLHTGAKVVVKVQRPGIKKVIYQDLEIMMNLAKLLDEVMDQQKPYHLQELFEEFSHSLKRELDYTYEARNAEAFRENFKEIQSVKIPKIYWPYTTKRILTMEQIYGIKILDTEALKKKGWDLKSLANIGVKAFMKQIFIDGFFHGDPHPGNILAVGPRRIALIDFGSVGHLDRGAMDQLTAMFLAVTQRDVEQIVEILVEMETLGPGTNRRRLKEDISFLLNSYYNLPLSQLDVGVALQELLALAYAHSIRFPAQMTLLFKVLIALEGTGKKLDPDFNLSYGAKGYLLEIQRHRYHPKRLLLSLGKYMESSFVGARDLPKQLRHILTKIEKNDLKIQMEHRGLEALDYTLHRITNRISLSVIIASLIIGSSLVIYSEKGPNVGNISLFGLVGYFMASLLGVGMVFSILFGGQRKK